MPRLYPGEFFEKKFNAAEQLASLRLSFGDRFDSLNSRSLALKTNQNTSCIEGYAIPSATDLATDTTVHTVDLRTICMSTNENVADCVSTRANDAHSATDWERLSDSYEVPIPTCFKVNYIS